MLKSTRHANQYSIRSRNLPGLMELYELNYIQLRRMIPDFDILPDINVSQTGAALDLHMRVLERAPYTTTLRLTYQFTDAEGSFPAPDVVLRLYHDAQLAEVISQGRRRGHRHADYDRFYHHYPKEMKWEANRFLHKWLGYCLRQGHGFSPAQRQFSEAVQAVADALPVDAES